MRNKNILAVFHYLSLHKSPYYLDRHDGRELENSDMFTDRLMRLPFYYDLTFEEIDTICIAIFEYFDGK
jgi:dTDP-4-amino-4,6-dideoxygalactose transaminase